MGRAFALLNILGHEAAHRLLFSRRRVNDLVGRWLLAYPGFMPFDLYRRSHMAHHRDEMGPDEPDLALYSGYPISPGFVAAQAGAATPWGSPAGRIWLRCCGRRRGRSSRALALRILGVQAVIWAAFWLASGRWWLYPVLWLAPWLTVWRVLNRLRAIAEHAGMERSDDRRRTTHVVRQRPLARFWMVPYHTGWHLAHHVDSGIPWRRLPELHAELVAAGWITPELEYPSYFALWRALASGSPSGRAHGPEGDREGVDPSFGLRNDGCWCVTSVRVPPGRKEGDHEHRFGECSRSSLSAWMGRPKPRPHCRGPSTRPGCARPGSTSCMPFRP